MFESTFAAELATRVGSTIEIATSNSYIEGILLRVTNGLVEIIESGGYGGNNPQNVALTAINYVRFPAAS